MTEIHTVRARGNPAIIVTDDDSEGLLTRLPAALDAQLVEGAGRVLTMVHTLANGDTRLNTAEWRYAALITADALHDTLNVIERMTGEEQQDGAD